MSSRLCRQSFSTTARAARSVRSNVHPPRRLMSADAAAGHHAEYKPKSDMPWIIGAAAISGPLLAYLLRDTFEIKKKIAAGHHGHDSHGSHDAHAASADHSEAHEEHVAKAEAKEKSDLTDAASSNALPSKQEESTTTDEAAAEPPKDANKQDKAEKEKAEKDEKDESK